MFLPYRNHTILILEHLLKIIVNWGVLGILLKNIFLIIKVLWISLFWDYDLFLLLILIWLYIIWLFQLLMNSILYIMAFKLNVILLTWCLFLMLLQHFKVMRLWSWLSSIIFSIRAFIINIIFIFLDFLLFFYLSSNVIWFLFKLV